MAVAPVVTTREADGVTWVIAELTLAPLAAGEYVVRATLTVAGKDEQALAPFRVIH